VKLDFQDTLPHKESERNFVGLACHEIQAFRLFSEHTKTEEELLPLTAQRRIWFFNRP